MLEYPGVGNYECDFQDEEADMWASMFGNESAEKVSEIVNKNIEQTNKKVKKNLDELTPRAVKLSTMSGVMHLLV